MPYHVIYSLTHAFLRACSMIKLDTTELDTTELDATELDTTELDTTELDTTLS